MGPINSLPLGFLDLLGLQQQGRNLPEVAEALAAVIDLTPFYAAYKRTFVIGDTNFAASAANSVLVGTVPVGEYWYVIGGLMSNASGAGSTGTAYVEVTQEGRSVFVSDSLSLAVGAANTAIAINFKSTLPLILAPGSTVQKFGFGMAGAGNERMNVRLAYLPLRG